MWSARISTPLLPASINVIGAVALHAAIDTLAGIGWPALISHERRIGRLLREGLAAIPRVHLLGPAADAEALPVATFTVEGVRHALVAARLAAEEAIGDFHPCGHVPGLTGQADCHNAPCSPG